MAFMKRLRCFLVVLSMVSAAPAVGVQPDEMLANPTLETRARSLSRELRCMVCQNQSIDDSDAPLARDLRILVRERLTAGDSDRQVLDFLIARYGDFVLLNPRVTSGTILLWLLPALVLLGGALALFGAARRQRRRARAGNKATDVLTPAEQLRLAQLIKPDDAATKT
jgi:cytochrome c-type biogenesis protein CcmH